MNTSTELGYCKSCGKPVKWITTQSGRRIPIDPESASQQDTQYDKAKHRTHFITCDNTAYWLRARQLRQAQVEDMANADPLAGYHVYAIAKQHFGKMTK